jgi:sarcosine oxidase subunit beta
MATGHYRADKDINRGRPSVATSVVIVGGGLMGLSAALHLRRSDASVRVRVLERDRVGAAASGASAAGVRAMGRDAAERALALASLARWPHLDRELEGRTGYRRGGGLRVALDEDAWRAAPGWVAEQEAHGVPVRVVDAVEARALVPGISPDCLGGVHCAIDGHAEAMPTVLAFAAAARRLGADVRERAGVDALVTERGRVVGVVQSDGRRHSCDAVILTGGAWSGGLLAGLGLAVPLSARALQMLLTDPVAPALTPVVGGFGRPLSLKQLDDGAYLIGGGWPARVVDEPANKLEVLEESVRGSLAVAREVYPALGSPPLARSWAGLEAFMPDELPVLGPVPGVEGLFLAAGFSGHGFALSPVVGDILARLTLGGDARPDLWRGLRLDRPALRRRPA